MACVVSDRSKESYGTKDGKDFSLKNSTYKNESQIECPITQSGNLTVGLQAT